MGRASRPILLLVFADPRRDLGGLKMELSGLRKLFRRDTRCEIMTLDHPSLAEIEDAFQQYRNQIVGFHYAGHADGFRQFLESDSGAEQNIDARGLARFLATQRSLRFAFLNGCSTAAQVRSFFDAGIPCVVATTRDIPDELATRFSLAFYGGVESGASLDESFQEAVGAVLARSGSARSNQPSEASRGVRFGEQKVSAQHPETYWQLHGQDARSTAWSLEHEVALRRTNRDAADPVSQRQLEQLLKKVDDIWIRGVLERNAPVEESIQLSKESRPDSINDPMEAVIEYANDEREVLNPDTGIDEVYDSVRQRLLILGQPGSGKTTSLLELARDLIDRANRDPAHPVPVIFNLSTWDDPEQSLEFWIQEELSEKYQVPKRLSQPWIHQQELILFLDGLDECRDEYRAACVAAIHDFLDEIGAAGIVVTCRTEEYADLHEKLKLGGAIHLQPLTPAQVREFVSAQGPRLAPLARALESSAQLLELGQSPLMLNIMCQAFPDSAEAIDDLPTDATSADIQTTVFSRFVERMFRRRGRVNAPFAKTQTKHWLAWLARHNREENTSIFMIENIQPDWLDETRQQSFYGVLVSLCLTLLTGLAISSFWLGAARLSEDVDVAVNGGLLGRVFPMLLVWFLVVWRVDSWLPNFAALGDETLLKSMRQGALKLAFYFAIWSGLCGIQHLIGNDSGMLLPLLLTGGTGSLLLAVAGRNQRTILDICALEELGWSRRNALIGLLMGGATGLALWSVFWLFWSEEPKIRFFWNRDAQQFDGFEVMLIGLLMIGVEVGVLVGGLTPKFVTSESAPNTGMKTTIRWSRLLATISCLLVTLSLISITALLDPGVRSDNQPRTMLDFFLFSVATGISTLLIVGLLFGGLDWLKHKLLMRILTYTGQLPGDLPAFLEYAVQLNFMSRAGGGYLFMHRLLREHFAATVGAAEEDGI